MSHELNQPWPMLILGTFTEIPVSVNISVGEAAEFSCRHSTADVIGWRVNGSLISQVNPPHGITIEFIRGGSKLAIVGRPDFDGIEVVGVARFLSSPEESTYPPAILRGMSNTDIVYRKIKLNININFIIIIIFTVSVTTTTTEYISGMYIIIIIMLTIINVRQPLD